MEAHEAKYCHKGEHPTRSYRHTHQCEDSSLGLKELKISISILAKALLYKTTNPLQVTHFCSPYSRRTTGFQVYLKTSLNHTYTCTQAVLSLKLSKNILAYSKSSSSILYFVLTITHFQGISYK